jgi:hypothetical protein
MPLSPFSGPYVQKPKPTASLPGTTHVFNLEQYDAGAEPGQQATQIDALGHFGVLKQPWDGKPPIPVESATYYGGFTQKDVKPTPESGLLKLGMEKAPPLITTAVLLDAKQHVGGGQPMKAGELVTAQAHRSDAERARSCQARHPARRHRLCAYRLGRSLEGSGYREVLLLQGAGAFVRRGKIPRASDALSRSASIRRSSTRSRGNARRESRALRPERRRTCRSRCITTC